VLIFVGDEAVRVSEWPRWEGVRAEATVHQRKSRFDALVGQVGKARSELGRGEHALVDERARRQRREVRALFGREFVLDALAGDEQLAVEVDSGSGTRRVGDEQMSE